MTKVYGQTQSEKIAEENLVCRQIVREISNFGISERQRSMVIYLLALELEDISRMQAVTDLLKELCGAELFLTNTGEGGQDGSSNT